MQKNYQALTTPPIKLVFSRLNLRFLIKVGGVTQDGLFFNIEKLNSTLTHL